MYVSRRATVNDPWGDAMNLGPVVNSAYNDTGPCLSPDGLLLVFQDYGTPRPGGCGREDFWMTRRASLSDPWGPPVNLGPPVNGPNFEAAPRFFPDGSALKFSRESGGIWSDWRAPIIPIVDFNGDGKVDGTEVMAMA